METKFVHVNIIAKDWKKLARFYEKVFNCVPVPPERDPSGEWIEKGTGITGAEIKGIHLKLPGYDDSGPTLEIFQYNKNKERRGSIINREGFAHIAFRVDSIEEIRDAVLQEGGKLIGKIVTVEVKGAGNVTFLYLTDPEGNIIELQKWS
jgi:predicted enzyme related to lactoylglutathione lyase